MLQKYLILLQERREFLALYIALKYKEYGEHYKKSIGYGIDRLQYAIIEFEIALLTEILNLFTYRR